MDASLGMREPREGELQPVDRPLSFRSGHLFSKMAAPTALGGIMLITSFMVGNIVHPTFGKQSVDPSLKELPSAIARECEDVIRDSRSQIRHLIDMDDFDHPINLVSRDDISFAQRGNNFAEDACTFRVHEHDGKTLAQIGFDRLWTDYKGDIIEPSILEGNSAQTSQRVVSPSLELDRRFNESHGKKSHYSLSWPSRGDPHYVQESQETSPSFFRKIASFFGFHPKLDVDTLWMERNSDQVIATAQSLESIAQLRLQQEVRRKEETTFR